MRLRQLRFGLAVVLVLAFIGLTLVSASGGEEGRDGKKGAVSASPSPGASASASVGSTPAADRAGVVLTSAAIEKTMQASCLSDPTVIDDLKKKGEELEQKAKALEAKEAELKAKEAALETELKRLDKVRLDIEAAKGLVKKDNEEKVAKLVTTFETMSPKAAAQLIGQIDDSLAVAAMSRMTTVKLAKIMNVMEAARSSRLTELMAGTIRAERGTEGSRASASPDAAVDGGKSAKGGEQDNGHNEHTD